MTIGNDGPPNRKAEPQAARADGQVSSSDHMPAAQAPALPSPGTPPAPVRSEEASPPVAAMPARDSAHAPAPAPEGPVEEARAHEAEREATIRAALNRVLASSDLRGSPRLGTFLRFVVEATLAGRAEQIKGYTIAVEALGRPPTFDPQADPIVRVEATRLRRALQSYYGHEGADDPLRIHIPKGGYVPVFEMRAQPETAPSSAQTGSSGESETIPAGGADAALPDAGHVPVSHVPVGRVPAAFEPQALEGKVDDRPRPDLPPVVSTESGHAPRSGARVAFAAAAAVVLSVVVALLALPLVSEAFRGTTARNTDKVLLPLVEVGQLGGDSPQGLDLRRLEERMRDAFALFDFVDVRADAAGDEDWVRQECIGPGARSVFSLNGLSVMGQDGSADLMLHLKDRCAGVIIWSHTVEGVGGHEGPGSETRIVNAVSMALMESYGVIPVRARSRALAQAPHSGFGCIAEAFAVLRGDGSATADVPRLCLAELTTRDREFALGHAVQAAALLDAAVRSPAPVSEQNAALMLREAELAGDLAPSSAFAARTLALTQMFLGETQAALVSAERALRLNPLDLDVAAAAGQIFIAAGEVERGEALLTEARAQGAARAPLQETYLAFAAFLRRDAFAVQALVPQLSLHPSPQNRIALVLALQMLGRGQDARALVQTLTQEEAGSPDAVRRLVQHLLPARDVYQKVLAALESAGLDLGREEKSSPRG